MPTVKIGDRVTLKRTPLYCQIPEWGDDRKIPVFPIDQAFEVIEIQKSKVTLQAIDHEKTRFFEWFKNALSKAVSVAEVEIPSQPEEEIDDRLFRPSNSDQGLAFEAKWCQKCDRYGEEGIDCDILNHATVGYVEQWQYKDGEPICTEWTEKQKKTRTVREVVSINVSPTGKASLNYIDREVPEEPGMIPPEKLLKFPETKAEFTTAITSYKGVRYWVAGKHPVGNKPGEYHYFIEANGTITKSELPYSGVAITNRWAREAIDKLAALQEVEF